MGKEATSTSATDYASLLPLTTPVASLVKDGTALASDQASLLQEQDLLVNPRNEHAWASHLAALVELVERDILESRSIVTDADTHVLGQRLASSAGRKGYRILVSAYERWLAYFPTSFSTWRDYLKLRQTFILGKPSQKLNIGAPKKKRKDGTGGEGLTVLEFLETEDKELEDSDRDDDLGPWDGALDGIIGWDEWRALAAAHERAIMWLPTMPRLWLMYITTLTHPSCPAPLCNTHARRTFDRALRSLPHTLHERIWKQYLRWADRSASSEASIRVWRRYMEVDPSVTHRFANFLVTEADSAAVDNDNENDEDEDNGKPSRALEAAKLLLSIARRARKGKYKSPDGKSPYQLLGDWLEICEKFPEAVGLSPEQVAALPPREITLQSNPKPTNLEGAMVPRNAAGKKKAEQSEAQPVEVESEVYDPDVDARSPEKLDVGYLIKTEGLDVYQDQAGPLWTGLATYWTKRGEFDLARETFEKGMATVLTIRDFTNIFDAYSEFSEQYMSSLMEALANPDPDEDEVAGKEEEEELDGRMKEFEELMDRRPFLVNEVLLRRNPNDVQEWEKRVTLWGTDDSKVAETYTKAIETIHPKKATANFHSLFVNFAKWYEEGGSATVEDEKAEADIESSRKVFEKGTRISFKRVEDLAEIWIEWAEMEVRNQNYDEALQVMKRATIVPRKPKGTSFHDESLSVQTRLFKSLKLWSFRLDLEEAIGTVESTKVAYDQVFELKIANAQVVVNFANFLEENEYWEESFKVYERGLDMFSYPIAFELWNIYLSKFMKRFAGTKLERSRDLFEQSLKDCPEQFTKPIFLMYAKLEEDFGLAKRAMNVLERASEKVALNDRFEMYSYYIAKATENFGLPATRPIYQKAIERLPNHQTSEMCLRFASLEQKLGEIDRARAIFAHASQFCDPRVEKKFWEAFHTFEIQHGSEDTFREMLRIKRAVQAAFNTETSYLAARAAAARASTKVEGGEIESNGDAMTALENSNANSLSKPAFIPSKDRMLTEVPKVNGNGTTTVNADEIAIDDDEDEDDGE